MIIKEMFKVFFFEANMMILLAFLFLLRGIDLASNI